MLLKSRISQFSIYSDEWKRERLGKFTSSKAFKLTAPKGFGKTGINYIRTRVGEEITGVSSEKDFYSEDAEWGIKYEPEAGLKFCEKMKLTPQLIVSQKFIYGESERFGSTPDLIIPIAELPDKDAWSVETGEIKCFPSYDHYIEMYECESPQQVKEADNEVYWQVLDQMDTCGALRGYAIFYHPLFRSGNMRIIDFRLATDRSLRDDIAFLRTRKAEAERIFQEKRSKFW